MVRCLHLLVLTSGVACGTAENMALLAVRAPELEYATSPHTLAASPRETKLIHGHPYVETSGYVGIEPYELMVELDWPSEPNGLVYSPSSFEKTWTATPRAGTLCATALAQTQTASLWVNYSRSIFHADKQPSRKPSSEEEVVLSFFSDGTGAKQFIEPLSGMARHPLAFEGVKCGSDSQVATELRGGKFDIDFLITTNMCNVSGVKPRSVMFDLGCTTYAGKLDLDTGSGSGPSIPLFHSMFAEHCVDFDEIFAWEAKTSKDDWWTEVPVDIRRKLHFYNTPVGELSVNQSVHGELAGDNSFLRMLPLAVKPEDFVVVKVDIDGGPELNILEAIAARPELAELVDEIFFEYHFDFDGNFFGWAPEIEHGTVDDAIKLMSRLRERGIRSHFWI